MNYGIPLNQRNEFVRKQLSGMSSWKVKGSVPISQVLRDAIRNKNNLQTMDIIEKYVKYLRCLKYPSSIHESQKKKKKKENQNDKSKRNSERNIGAQSKTNLKIF